MKLEALQVLKENLELPDNDRSGTLSLLPSRTGNNPFRTKRSRNVSGLTSNQRMFLYISLLLYATSTECNPEYKNARAISLTF